jgi:hypothetical protein
MLSDKSPAAIQARYAAACAAIGKEDPSLTITDSHEDIPHLLTVNRDLLTALQKIRAEESCSPVIAYIADKAVASAGQA